MNPGVAEFKPTRAFAPCSDEGRLAADLASELACLIDKLLLDKVALVPAMALVATESDSSERLAISFKNLLSHQQINALVDRNNLQLQSVQQVHLKALDLIVHGRADHNKQLVYFNPQRFRLSSS